MDPPRYLTAAEIASIVAVVPEVQAAVPEAGRHIQFEIQRQLTRQLMNFRLVPHKIPTLKGWVLNQFVRSVVTPGEAVGMTASEANGQPITQMNLNAFHHAGSARANYSGLDSFRELVNMTPNRKHEFTRLHFKDKNLTLSSIAEIRRQFEGVTARDVLLRSHSHSHRDGSGNDIDPLRATQIIAIQADPGFE